jgi:hypothetical protein
LFDFAQSDGFWANLETTFGRSYDVVKATEFNEKTGFSEKLFRNPFSLVFRNRVLREPI